MATRVPRKFQVPNIKSYEGKSGLTYFKTFHCLLEKSALDWFPNLPRGCLHPYEDLIKQFKACLATNRAVVKSTTSLVSLQQKPSESLNAFMDRFNTKIEKIKNLNSIVALHAMIASLKPRPLPDSLAKREPTTSTELWHHAVGYINLEELGASKIQGPMKIDKGKAPAHDPLHKREEK